MQVYQKSSFQKFRSQIMGVLAPLTDKEYKQLKKEPNISKRQQDFVQVYENIYMGYLASIFLLFPSIYYSKKSVSYRNRMVAHQPNYTIQGFNSIKNKLFTCSSLGLAFIIATEVYSWRNSFSRRSQEITQKYKGL